MHKFINNLKTGTIMKTEINIQLTGLVEKRANDFEKSHYIF